jgi:hypothetical protein
MAIDGLAIRRACLSKIIDADFDRISGVAQQEYESTSAVLASKRKIVELMVETDVLDGTL